MIISFLSCLALGALASWRSKAVLRAHNRRMFPSMQDRSRAYLRPIILFTLLGAALAAALSFKP